jgi:hypothetical protein
MRYCGPRGIPLSTFLSWPRADQDAALTWQAHEAERCPGCGRHPDDPPTHAHKASCPTCAEQSEVAKKAHDLPGGHVQWSPGMRSDCPTCSPQRGR